MTISNEVLIVLMWLGLIIGLVFLGAHMGFVLGMVAIGVGFIGWEGTGFLSLFPIRIWGILKNYVLVAVPLFVFMGYMLERSGLGDDLFSGIEVLFGKLRGGMAITVIIVTTIVAACTGIVATGVIMAGLLALPPMLRRGYDKGLACGVVAAGGTLGILIPPSVMLVFYAAMTRVSVGKLFLGAFPSGFLLSALYIIYTTIMVNLRPKIAPLRGEVPEVEIPGMPVVIDMEKVIAESRHLRLRMIRGIFPVLLLIGAVMGTIVFGIATPTEAAAFGALGAMVVAAFYRRLNFNTLSQACMGSAKTMGMFGGIAVGALCFSAIFMGLGGKEIVYNLMVGLDVPDMVLLWIMVGIVVFMGCFLDDLAILIILLPVFVPVQQAMGWHEIWFALVFCVAMQTAWLTPPFGYALVYLKGVQMPGIDFLTIVKGCAPFVGLQLIGVAILIAFPKIITFLPDLLIR